MAHFFFICFFFGGWGFGICTTYLVEVALMDKRKTMIYKYLAIHTLQISALSKHRLLLNVWMGSRCGRKFKWQQLKDLMLGSTKSWKQQTSSSPESGHPIPA